jgi:putative transposase
MARRPRLVLPAVPLHIIQRGNNRNRCFACEADYLVYLTLARQYAAEAACQVHAYVLMTNHVHLLLSSGNATGPSLLMRRLGQHYVQYFNRRHARTGTLWEGRFRSCLVEDERYLLICQRYIELNPVRAGMVGDPGTTDGRATGQMPSVPITISCHAASDLHGLGRHEGRAARHYRDLFKEALSDQLLTQIRQASNGNAPLGPGGVCR